MLLDLRMIFHPDQLISELDIKSGEQSGEGDVPAIFINGTRQQSLSMRFIYELMSGGGHVSG